MKFLIDSSAWLAFLLENEQDHKEVVGFIDEKTRDRDQFITTNDIVDETVTRLIYGKNRRVADKFIVLLEQGTKDKSIIQLWTDEQIQKAAYELLTKFSDQRLSLTDATSIVILRRFNLDGIISLDSDFKKVGVATFP